MSHTNLQLFKSTCSYCGVGCGIEILKQANGKLDLRGDQNNPANRGLLCAKGRSLLHTVRSTDTRLKIPHLRTNRDVPLQPTSWAAAMNHIAAQFKRIIADHGPDAVAFYVSGQCLTEEYYLANKIAKGFIGTNNIDTNSRLCMSSAVAGYKATLGSDAPPISYEDIDHCDTFLIAGANPAWCHPVLFRRIEVRKESHPDTKVIVIDPRRTASCSIADLHLPIRPGTDVPLFLGLARQLWRTNQLDLHFIQDHTTGFDAFLDSFGEWTLQKTAQTCGLNECDIALAAEYLSKDRTFLSLWTMGLNQSAVGTDKNIALISLSLITGKIGKLGSGPFSLTGQPNAMGGREVGGLANLLPAHRNLANPQHRKEVAHFWNVPENRISPNPGLTAIELFDALAAKKVKAVWIIATNPIASLPNSWQAEAALKRAELVIVQDIYSTETTDYADVILPAAAWLEKAGTMTNSDRRISLLEKVLDPPGQALADTEILTQFAHAMGWQSHFNYQTPAEIFAEHAALTKNTDIDITSLTHQKLKEHGTAQWPAPTPLETRNSKLETPPGIPRLYTNHLFPTPTTRATLHPLQYKNLSEPTSPAFPLILTTGRIRDHWHTMTKTGQVQKLSSHINTPFCEIHPTDAAERNISHDDIVTVTSARGFVQLRAVVTTDIRPGVLFLPMHWGKKISGPNASARANNLTNSRFDPISKEPDLKFTPVQLAPFTPVKRRIVIIGGGAACLAFIEQHRAVNQRDQITVFSAEPQPIYNRVLLPHYIDGSRPFHSIVRADDSFFSSHNITYHRGRPIRSINRHDKTITDYDQISHPYDLLILATGSRPAIHYDGPLPESGTFTLRSRQDADQILAASKNAQHVVIVGGGLLGLELADALTLLQNHVTILQRSDRLMGKQLDLTAATLLAEEIQDRNIAIHFNTSLIGVTGTDSVHSIRILPQHAPEQSLPCDMLIFATGIVPNKELAGAAGLDCERGILISPHLQTSDKSIFAIGECAQLGEQTFGTTPAAEEQAAALAQFLRGNLHVPYKGTTTANMLKVHGLQLASAGQVEEIPHPPVDVLLPPDPTPLPNTEVLILSDPAKRYYQKLLVQNDRLIGAICLGDTSRFPEYLRLIASRLELDDLRDTLLRPTAPSQPLDGTLICSCNHIGQNTILKALPSCGPNLQKICAATRAGTTCGSCKPEIEQLIKAASAPPQSHPITSRIVAQASR